MFNGIFGDLFDFNGDGRLDTIEQAAEFAFFDELTKEKNNEKHSKEARNEARAPGKSNDSLN